MIHEIEDFLRVIEDYAKGVLPATNCGCWCTCTCIAAYNGMMATGTAGMTGTLYTL